METDNLEGGGTFIKLQVGEAAVVWADGETSIILPPMKKVPEEMALFLFAFARLQSDDEFRAEMLRDFKRMAK